MPTPYDYFMQAGQSLGTGLGAVGHAASPINPMQQAMAAVLSGRLKPREAAVRIRHGLPIDGGAPMGGPSAGGAPAQPQGPMAPHTNMQMAPGSDGGLSAQAMQMANQPPSSLMTPSGPPSLGTPPAPMAASPSLAQAPSSSPFPMPTNQQEYGQLMQGAGILGDLQKAARPTLEDRLVEIAAKGGESRKTEGMRQEGATGRVQMQQEGAGARSDAAEAGREGRFTRQEQRLADDAVAKNKIAQQRANTAEQWAQRRLQQLEKGGKADNRDRQAQAILQRMIARLRSSSTTLRKPDAFGQEVPGNRVKADEFDKKAEDLENRLLERMGPDALGDADDEALPTYLQGGDPLEEEIPLPGLPDGEGGDGSGYGAPAIRGGTGTNVQEPEEGPDLDASRFRQKRGSIEYRRAQDGRLLAKINGRVVVVG